MWSGDYSVYDGWVYTQSLVARTFFCAQVAHCVHRTFLCVSHARMAQGLRSRKRCLLHVCHVSPSHLPFSHESVYLCCSLTVTSRPLPSVHVILPYFPVLKAQNTHNSSFTSRSLAGWPNQMQTHSIQVMSPQGSTRSLLWTMRRCLLTIGTSMKSLTSRKHKREQWTVRCSHNV